MNRVQWSRLISRPALGMRRDAHFLAHRPTRRAVCPLRRRSPLFPRAPHRLSASLTSPDLAISFITYKFDEIQDKGLGEAS